MLAGDVDWKTTTVRKFSDLTPQLRRLLTDFLTLQSYATFSVELKIIAPLLCHSFTYWFLLALKVAITAARLSTDPEPVT